MRFLIRTGEKDFGHFDDLDRVAWIYLRCYLGSQMPIVYRSCVDLGGTLVWRSDLVYFYR